MVLVRALSSLTASGAIGILFSDKFALKLATALVSLGTVALTAYMKGFDPGATAQRHRDTAADIWPIRESYLSLLTDIVGGNEVGAVAAIYKGAPHTDGKAYKDSQIALKQNEEYTFNDEEIDAFLPIELRKKNRISTSAKE
jgi:SMODS and SLOG-associating 2TM effector domain family 4